MNRAAVVIGLLLFGFGINAQDTSYVRKKVRESDVRLLLSYYDQDGVHSAVTGGTGTEKLEVYAVDLNTQTTTERGNDILVGLGVDIISSASTDRIDYEVSSASRVDQRTHATLGYEKKLRNNQWLGGMLYYSIESDYTARGIGAWYRRADRDNTRRMGLHFTAYLDDLRWGRLSKPYLQPKKLIYPVELRYREWFDIYQRYSFNVNLSYEIDLNQRMNLSFYPVLVYQQGLLSTTFHRVYFKNSNIIRVENLPRNRAQIALGTQFNSYLGKRTILRGFYQIYADDFGLTSHTLKLEVPLKLNARYSIAPFSRFYQQSGVRYFMPFAQHNPDTEFYTSDYDLSGFWSGQFGLNLSLAMTSSGLSKYRPRTLQIRYSYYQREDGLKAHLLALVFEFRAIKFREQVYGREMQKSD